MTLRAPEQFNCADYFLDARIREGFADKTAIVCGERKLSYRDVQALSNRFGNLLRSLGVESEQRVLIGLPDIPEFAGALFGTLKIGAVVVMVNAYLKPDAIAYFYDYTRAKVAVVHPDQLALFEAALKTAKHRPKLLVPGDNVEKESAELENFPSHRDDAAIWLFSGGTTGRPKAVVQSHNSFANTTELYAKGVIGYTKDDITLSVPKLYFGYATGSNLLFPFSVGATVVLFPERCTPECLFEKIRTHKPTVLINVPTMVNQLVNHPDAGSQDLSSIRVVTSAGEALPEELHKRWRKTFGAELLDGLGTAEMWHIFISNRPDDVKPGTLGKVVPGFEVKVRDDDGNDVPAGEVGWLWVRGDSRAIGYWQQMERTQKAFQGEWYVSGDMIRMDAEGYVTYCGRGDDMLKVSGKWLAPKEVENCLLQNAGVKECAVVGVADLNGLTLPHAFVVKRGKTDEETLKKFVKEKLETYKAPRKIVFLDELPRTHLGKVDRGKLRKT